MKLTVVCFVLFLCHFGEFADYYVGGKFDHVGDGVPAANFAKFSNGAWSPINLVEQDGGPFQISCLATYGSILYYAYFSSDEYFPFQTFPVGALTTTSGLQILVNLPRSISFNKVNTILPVDENTVFFGGAFEIKLANGVTAYDSEFHFSLFLFLCCFTESFHYSLQ